MSTGKAKRGPCLLAVALVLALFLLGAVAGCHEARLACQHDGGCRDAEGMGYATRSAVLSLFFFFFLLSTCLVWPCDVAKRPGRGLIGCHARKGGDPGPGCET